jgi:uncharacterized membrane protein
MLKLKWVQNDQTIEEIVGSILRTGVIIATAVVLIGGMMYFIRHGFEVPDYRAFHGEPTDLRTVSGIMADIFSLRSRGVIQFGLLLLIAAPMTRVAFSCIAFLRRNDRTYFVITLIVFALLIFSLTGIYV